MDLRFEVDLTETVCDVVATHDGGIEDARLIAPGDPERSLVYLRPQLPDWRMPPLGTNLVSEDGVEMLGDWIAAMKACTP